MPVETPEIASGTIETVETQSILLPDILRVVKKYYLLTVILSLSFAVVAFLWSRQQTRLYDASAMIEVDQHGILSLSSSAAGLTTEDYELKIQTLILTIESRDVALNVINRLHLERNAYFNPNLPKFTDLSDPYTRNRQVNAFLAGLKVQRIPRSQLVSVTYRSVSPVLSTEVANATVNAYLETNFQHRYQGSKEITGWLTAELDELKQRVQGEQTDLLNLEGKLGIVQSGSQGETSLYEKQLEELLSEEIKTQTQNYEAQELYNGMVKDDSGAYPPPALAGSSTFNYLQSQLAQLEAQKSTLSARYGPGYPPLQQVENTEKSIKKSVADQRQRILSAAHNDVQATQKALADIQTRIDQLKTQSKGLTPDTIHFYQLRAQYTADETLYNGLLSLLRAGGIESGLKSQEVNRMSTADFPTMPSRPRVYVTAAAGFGLGALLSVVIIAVVIATSDTVETIEQVQEVLGLPVIAAVPFYKLEAGARSDQMLPVAAQIAPRSSGAESYRILRTSISLMPARRAARVIGITSCGPGEGKSTTALNLGVVFSQQNKRVLLVDADLRKPNLSQWLRQPSDRVLGLARYLSDPSVHPEECLRSFDTLSSLSFMPVGQIPPFPSELLAGKRFEDLINWANENFDVVLIDTPPALLVTDALIVAQYVDITLLVARVGVAQRRALRRVRHELTGLSQRHVAVVVNAVPLSQSYYGGYGGYGNYYVSDDRS